MKGLLFDLMGKFFSEQAITKLKEFVFEVKLDISDRKARKKLGRLALPCSLMLNIGCGSNVKKGWLNIDFCKEANFNIDVRKGLPFVNNSVEVIYSEHFLEHLDYPKESLPFLMECYRVLKNGGVIHVGVPDSRYVVESCIIEPIASKFLQKVKKYNWGYPSHCNTGFEYINYHFRLEGFHKFAYDFLTLKCHLEKAGFKKIENRGFDPDLDTVERADGSLYVAAIK